MRLDWVGSAPLTLTLVDGAEVNLRCGPNYSTANALGALFKPNEWLYLEAER